jgi:O-acetyl-ADP-ribose deacetylase (regulator of RNase III)
MLTLLLRDLNADVVSAWKTEFEATAEVEVSLGSILELKADAIVSPANSFGYMDGGIDLAYSRFFGFELQERLQALLNDRYHGELPVGQAVVVETAHPGIPFLVSAPTMRVPSSIAKSINVYLAFRATLGAILEHNRKHPKPIARVAVPGMGTGVGEVSPARAARHMRIAYDAMLGRHRGLRRSVSQIWSEHQELMA